MLRTPEQSAQDFPYLSICVTPFTGSRSVYLPVSVLPYVVIHCPQDQHKDVSTYTSCSAASGIALLRDRGINAEGNPPTEFFAEMPLSLLNFRIDPTYLQPRNPH